MNKTFTQHVALLWHHLRSESDVAKKRNKKQSKSNLIYTSLFVCKFFLFGTLILTTSAQYAYAQQNAAQNISVKGKVVDDKDGQGIPGITIMDNERKVIGITNESGDFSVNIPKGTAVSFTMIGYTTVARTFSDAQNNIVIRIKESSSQLNEVVVRAEKSSVEIKLDKKVYNVGQDMIVKGGSVSDVLDNVPSVSVDTEGNVSLRGSDNIRILIDGRPSGGVNIADVLKLLPADAVDKVEVITNPSARYDAEGGGGILNIVLKKGDEMGRFLLGSTVVLLWPSLEQAGFAFNPSWQATSPVQMGQAMATLNEPLASSL